MKEGVQFSFCDMANDSRHPEVLKIIQRLRSGTTEEELGEVAPKHLAEARRIITAIDSLDQEAAKRGIEKPEPNDVRGKLGFTMSELADSI